MGLTIKAQPIIPGRAEGTVVHSRKALSFWGGVDPETGVVIDCHHDLCGKSIAGKVFVFPGEKGSSTASAVLVELVRNGRAPAALIVMTPSPILALGAIIAEQLYGRTVPLALLQEQDACKLHSGDFAIIDVNGMIKTID